MTITECGRNWNNTVIPEAYNDNSINDMVIRCAGYKLSTTVNVTGTGTVVANVLQLNGTVIVISQWALITAVTTLTNLTGMYATLYDGTNTVNLTSDGAVLSGAPVGTFFTKDQLAAQTYTVMLADECRVNETIDAKKAGRPFTITQKNGTDTFIRLHYTTTDSPVDFTVAIGFEYIPLNGGTLAFL